MRCYFLVFSFDPPRPGVPPPGEWNGSNFGLALVMSGGPDSETPAVV
jgi:hypothetical protein